MVRRLAARFNRSGAMKVIPFSERDFFGTGVDRILLAASPLDQWGSDLNEGCARLIERFPEKAVGLIGIHPPDVDQSLRDIATSRVSNLKARRPGSSSAAVCRPQSARPAPCRGDGSGWAK
jgi:hypothetical protein